MTQSTVTDFLRFHYWARDRMLAACATLSPEQLNAPIESSFPSVRATLVHVYSADWVWCTRWEGQSPTTHLVPDDYPDVAAIAAAWRDIQARALAVVGAWGDDGLAQAFDYALLNGSPYRSIRWQTVMHVVNHGTYHRGQVTTMLRQLGAKPPSTDLIAFYRQEQEMRNEMKNEG